MDDWSAAAMDNYMYKSRSIMCNLCNLGARSMCAICFGIVSPLAH